MTLHELFEAQARREPERIALVFEPEPGGPRVELTYGELNRRADHLASRLRSLGVGLEQRVGVSLDRSPGMLVALLAILKAGGAYAPLDPSYPRERLALMMEDAYAGLASPVLLTRDWLLPRLPDPPPGVQVLCLEGHVEDIEDGEEDEGREYVVAGNLAYLIFTSGSTGRPKAVAIEHRSAVELIHWAREVYSQEELAGVFAATSINFDLSVFELFVPLSWGGRVVLGENALALARTPAAREVTLLNTVPSAIAELLRMGAVPPSIKTVNLAGEPLRGALAQRIHELGTVERLWNLYGPSEDTTYSTGTEVPPGEGEPTIGRPLPGTQAHVLDNALDRVSGEDVGELFLAGLGLARGYLNRPDLTAERFVPDPFSAEPGGRMYRTGDLVRWLPEGDLKYIGRIDHQVKIRGYRIEIGEVEAALSSCPGLRDVAVLVREDVPGEKRLVGYVVASQPSVSSSSILDFLRARIPDPMLPSAFVLLDEMPLNPNGKIDRGALGRIAPSGAEQKGVAPRTPVETVLAEVWSEALGVERIGVTDDFMESGGHSLLASRILSRVRELFGVDLPLGALFETPTVAALALRIESEETSSLPPIRRVLREAPLPLSFAQERLWFLDRLISNPAVYHMPYLVRLQGELDRNALERALSGIVERHEILRTVIVAGDAGARQVVQPPRPISLPLSDLPDSLVEKARQPFDLTKDLLLRAELFRLEDDDHLLLLNMHHIASDGWSVEILARELAVLYQGDPLAELPIQYADFAVWQREWLRGDVLEEQVSWWKEALEGAPVLLDLPVDRPQQATLTFSGARRNLSVPADLSDAIRNLYRQTGTTLFMTLLAAFQALIHRLTAQRDFLVGAPIANRRRRETESLIGFFVNTLALRGRVEEESTLQSLLRQARATALGAYSHQDLPFERLVEELRIERSLGYNPLVQAVLAIQDPLKTFSLPGFEMSFEELHAGTAPFDLFLALSEEDGLSGFLEYSSDLFDPTTAQRLASHFLSLLASAVAEPDRRISELPLLSGAEQHQLRSEWNDTRTGYPREATLHGLFEEQARLRPRAVALRSADGETTYEELRAQTEALAARLRREGVGPDTLVALFLERSPEAIVAILAILQAGGAYAPLDPSYPAERLALMLADSAAPVLVTRRELLDRLPKNGAHVVLLEQEDPLHRLHPLQTLPAVVHPENLAYVMYTSGSTGRPKGVAVTHRNVVRLVKETWYVDLGADQLFLQLAPLSFDASTLEIWGALLNGGTLMVFPAGTPTLEELGRFLAREGITTLWLTAGLFHQMVETQVESFRGLRQLLAGGDVLSPPHVERVLREVPGLVLINGYGPTESTTFTCCHPVRGSGWDGGAVPIGRPISNTRVHLLDSGLRSVPLGASGELCIGGDGLARGYLNRPELTAERFVPDPLGAHGERLYRTGDLARFRHDGAVDFLGRIDQQVKIRGFRIEPGEIEAVLAGHPAVAEAAVVVQGEGSDKRLVAFLVGSSEDLRPFLAERLPVYMVPSALVWLESMPLNPNGKVDRRALSRLAPTQERHEITAPRTPTEELLAGIWADILGMDLVGVDEDFFELGGHSLLATRLVSRMHTTLGVELPLRAVFNAPTVAGLARRVDAALREGGQENLSIQPVPREGLLPLSFSQERLWLFERLMPGSAAYVIPLGFRLEGRLDQRRLEQALNEIVRRHEALRTTFPTVEGRPYQEIHPFRPAPLPVVSLPEELRPFDLESGPLLRAALVEVDEDVHDLWLSMHHIVSDGWSLGVLTSELGRLYSGKTLPELPVQYVDFAAWQRDLLDGDVLRRQLAWWMRELQGAPARLDLPFDRPRPAVQSLRGALRTAKVPAETAARLRSLSRTNGATLFMTLLAAFQGLLHGYTDAEDLLVGTPVANRNRSEIEGLIGFFVNTLVLRGRPTADIPFRDLLRQARSASLGAFAHQDVPFERLVEQLRIGRNLSHNPLFQVMFALQSAPPADLDLPGIAARALEPGVVATPFDITLSIWDRGGELAFEAEYATDLFDGATIDRLLGHFRILLEGIAAGPDRTLAGLPMMSDAERRQLLDRRPRKEVRSFQVQEEREIVAPRTPTEEILAGMWAGLLDRSRVGIHDSFFDLGGHSLLATRLVFAIAAELGVDLTLRDVFEAPTIATLAERIAERGQGLQAAPLERVDRKARDGDLPLSFAQERLWFLDRMEPDRSIYNMPFALRLRGDLHVPALEAALSEIVCRHEVLRTTFTQAGGTPRQVIGDPDLRLPVIDLPPREAERRLVEEGLRPFHLERGPLFRFLLFRLSEREHTLLLALHHIAGDGWSIDVLRSELAALYNGSPLAKLPVQYADYAVWQRRLLQGEILEREIAWWKERLEGAPAVLTLPYDRPRPAIQSFRGDLRRQPLILDAVQAVSRQHGTTLFMTLLAASQLLLHRLSAQDDILVGSPVAGRSRRELQGLIGFFVNNLVMRARFDEPGASFRDLLAQTRTSTLGAYSHQDLPFEKLVEELKVERSLSHNPVFQVMFTFQSGAAVPGLKGLETDWLELPIHSTKADLGITVDDQGAVSIEYASDLFDGTTIERMLGQLRMLLEGAVSEPGRPLAGLPILSEPERHQLLEWNDTEPERPLDAPVHLVFEEQARRMPDAVAVVFGEESFTYRELDRRAGLLAARLRRLGVKAETRVALMVERSLGLAVSILGIWKAGGAFVPLDSRQPDERLAFLVQDAVRGQETQVGVTQRSFQDRLQAFPEGVSWIFLEDEEEDQFEATASSLQDLAYVIYTSGTTGRPKGVLVEHGSLAQTLRASQEAFGFQPSDWTPGLASYTFDISLLEFLGPLLSGGTLKIFPLQPTLDVPLLVETLDELTILHAVPVLMREIVDGARRKGTGRRLRQVFIGGDAAPADLLADMHRAFPSAQLFVIYGPTEAAIICSQYVIDHAEPRVLLGRPLAGALLDVRDRNGALVPVGVPGELWIGGAGVARGYLHQPELTAEKFVTLDARRWYRSGDLARRLPDGSLEFLGRVDQQVKVRGFRIELGEIEEVLTQHPEVRQAAVIAVGEGSARRLAAFIVPAEPDGLRDRLAALLPDYMIPSSFTAIDALPRTVNNKVDRRELEKRVPERTAMSAEAWISPGTPTEVALAALWSEVLGVERVGLRDHFFNLGGHSLMAMRLLSRVAGELGVELPLRAIFEVPNLQAMAARIDTVRAAGTGLQVPPILPVDRGGDLPLSFAQERLWFLYQLEPESSLYNTSAALRLDGPVDVGALRASLAEIVRRHEVLRTTYANAEPGAVQRVQEQGEVDLPVTDLRGLARWEAEREAEALRLVQEEEHLPFDLQHGRDGRDGRVARFRLLRLDEDAWILLLSVHHIASDGWSTGVLIHELTELYSGHALPELPIQYGDFAVWQHGLQGEVLDRLLGYWRQALAGAPVRIDLPTDRPRPAVQRYRGATRPLNVSPALLHDADALSRKLGATLFMTLLAAFQIVLHRVTGQDDLLVGTPVAGRSRRETEGLIGCFLNTLVLRGRLDPERREEITFRELVGRVRSVALDAYAHQDLPFEKLVEDLQVERSPGRNPLFQVLFTLQNAPMEDPQLPGVAVSLVETDWDVALFDLSLGLGEFRGEVLGGLQYNVDLFDASTVDRWGEHFRILLEAAVQNPDQALRDLPRLTEPERRQVLANAVEAEPPSEQDEEELRTRIAGREEELAERRSGLSDQKRAALEKLLRARVKPK